MLTLAVVRVRPLDGAKAAFFVMVIVPVLYVSELPLMAELSVITMLVFVIDMLPFVESLAAPLIVIEILSLDDRMPAVQEKLEEYRVWGVPHVWLVDPHSRRMYTCQTAGLTEVSSLRIPELDVEVTPDAIFE